jgi:hypothetical protein
MVFYVSRIESGKPRIDHKEPLMVDTKALIDDTNPRVVDMETLIEMANQRKRS